MYSNILIFITQQIITYYIYDAINVVTTARRALLHAQKMEPATVPKRQTAIKNIERFRKKK